MATISSSFNLFFKNFVGVVLFCRAVPRYHDQVVLYWKFHVFISFSSLILFLIYECNLLINLFGSPSFFHSFRIVY
jgi:hypothetical protein